MTIVREDIVRRLISRLTRSRKPPVLYHYTSGAGLLGIVEHRSIWATGARYLNDSSELSLALQRAAEVVEEVKREEWSTFDKAVCEVMMESLRHAHHFEAFVTSFSEHGDQLSQWRGYCPPGEGYAMGMKPNRIHLPSGTSTDRYLAPCIYDSDTQKEHLEELISDVLEFANAMHTTDPDNSDRVFRESHKLFTELMALLAPAIKDSTFSEETEWRVISLPSSFGQAYPNYRRGRSMLVPYYNYPLAEGDSPLGLSEVIIGPMPHISLAERAVEGLLEANEVGPATVRSSTIPFRSW